MKKVIPFSSEREPGHPLSPAAPRAESVARDRAGPASGPEQQLLLLQRIMGCTDTQLLVERFHRWATELSLADAVHFTGVSEERSIALGPSRHHSAQYVLNLDGTPLGTIRLFRRERFSEEELMTLEQALGALTRGLHSAAEIETLRDLVAQDPLTGLGNRTSLHDCLRREVARAGRHTSPLTLMMIDVDNFKTINDDIGHLGGDDVLRSIADVLRDSTRRSDLLFRFGGDEFTIILPHTNSTGALEAARQIRKNLARADNTDLGLEDSPSGVRPDISIGIATFQGGDDEESLLQRADTHLYHAKARGRGRICTSV